MNGELYKNIVIATDGSRNTRRAISYGVELAKLSGATAFSPSLFMMSTILPGWGQVSREERVRYIYFFMNEMYKSLLCIGLLLL